MDSSKAPKKSNQPIIFYRRLTRREALSTGAKIGVAAGVAAIIAGVGGYFGGLASLPPAKTLTQTVKETVTQAGAPQTVTQTVTTTLAPGAAQTITQTMTQTIERTITQTVGVTPKVEVILGANAEERVYNGLKKLIEEGKIKPGTVITVLANPGAGTHWDKKYFKGFIDATNGMVDINVVMVPPEQTFSKIVTEAVEKSGAYDVFVIVPVADLPEVVEAGALYDITDFVNKYDPEMFGFPNGYPEQFQKSAGFYNKRWWGFNLDYDVWLTHYREDIYMDKGIRREFEDKFGYPLRPPVTWKEYRDQLEFFYRPDEPPRTKLNLSDEKGFFGGWDYKVPFWELFSIELRWWTTGYPYFDRNMNPTINKPEVVKAMKDMVEASKFQPKESFTAYWDVNYPWFQQGKMAFLISWTSLLKFVSLEGSRVKGKVKVAFAPGYPLAGDPDQVGIDRASVRTVGFIAASHVITVSKYSKNPELAYLFVQYYVSPTAGTKIVEDPAGYYEPYRYIHFQSPVFKKEWGEENLRVSLDNYDYLAPSLKLPGRPRYNDVLDREMNAALQGRKSVEDATSTIAKEWDKITNEIGRDKLIKAWNDVLENDIGPKLKPYLKV
ncbi:MAG: extracellular solute-binding protein [Nitrososphaerales archaeon]